jgi:hypothetical protein
MRGRWASVSIPTLLADVEIGDHLQTRKNPFR